MTKISDILMAIGENQHLLTMMGAAAEYILSTDDCSRETFMEMAGGAYSAIETQVVMHAESLMEKGNPNDKH